MSNATPEQIAKNAEAAAAAKAKREAEQKEFRENPAKLAAAIAAQIRMDNHANENPEDYDNGSMHWYQEAWANVKARAGSFHKLTSPVKYYGDYAKPQEHSFFEVSCPTTGCIAGWADSLAGFPLIFRKSVPDWELKEYQETTMDPNATVEDVVLSYYSEDEIINVDDCYDPILHKVRSIPDVAAELLALNVDQKDWLFAGGRVKDEVLWALDEMAEGNLDWEPQYEPEHECDEECEANRY